MIWEKYFLFFGFVIAVLSILYVDTRDKYYRNVLANDDCQRRGGELIMRFDTDLRWTCGKVEILLTGKE